MISRGALLAAFGIALMGSVLTLRESYGWGPGEEQPRRRVDRQVRNAKAAPQAPQPHGPGRHLAFDVRPRDHRATTRYVLEIAHPSGELTTHDLKKPALRKRTIMVPVPELGPGKYKFVVIAESPGGATRSKPLPLEIPEKTVERDVPVGPGLP